MRSTACSRLGPSSRRLTELARMLPQRCDPSTESMAERRLFDMFASDPGTKDWVVLHSLGLARRGKKPYGEIDFVVLVPGHGILCLEVKGGGISCNAGCWSTVDRTGERHILTRSPFNQAKDGMFALRESVVKRSEAGRFANLICGYSVVFPDVDDFTLESPEWERWQIIDRKTLGRPISVAVLRAFAELRVLHKAHKGDEPSASTIKELQQLLRPDYEGLFSRSAQLDHAEEQLTRLTKDQFVVLDQLARNPRCFFEGAAGTGKTMLAVEYARRAAESGSRTLLVCYNKLLGSWFVTSAVQSAAPGSLVRGSFFSLLRDAIVNSSESVHFKIAEEKGQGSDLYNVVYPYYGLRAIEQSNSPFDVLVVDEAQDLIREEVLDIFDAWLKGGLTNGTWAMFGDLERQALFGRDTATELRALAKHRAPDMAVGLLVTNCRNTLNIGQETCLLSGFAAPPYRMGQVAGAPVDYRYYDSPEEQGRLIDEVVSEMLVAGTPPSELVILSSRKLIASGASKAGRGHAFCILEAGDSSTRRAGTPVVRFATIQAFKGMESKTVILCDVEVVSDGEPQALLYVAMSRARARLTVIAHSRVRASIREFLRRRLQAEWTAS